MKFNAWEPKKRIEEAYSKALRALMRELSETLLGTDFTYDDPYDIISRLQEYVDKDYFRDFALAAASRMVTGLLYNGAKSWREAARKSMQGQRIYHALQNEMRGHVGNTMQNIINENAKLISTFPEDIAKEVNDFIRDETQKGRRAEGIARDLSTQFPEITRARINLIARTETSKAATALTQARAEDMNLDWYVWRTSEDARVRPSHRLMDKVLVSWKEPPSPEALDGEKRTYGVYAAGSFFNCRCYPEPMLKTDQVKWPCRVYHSGRIQQMTRAAFERLAGLIKIAA